MRFSQKAVAFVLFRASVAAVATAIAAAERSLIDTLNATAAFPPRKLAKGTFFFAQDDNGVEDDEGRVVPLESWPNSNAALQDLVSALDGLTIITESFENQTAIMPPFAIGEGIGVLHVHQNTKGKKVFAGIKVGPRFHGIYPTSGQRGFLVPNKSVVMLNFTESGPIVAIGFFATDMLDETRKRRVSVSTYDADGESNRKKYRPKVAIPGAKSNDGAVVFVGIYDPEGFKVVKIGNARSDNFGIDDLVIAPEAPATEPPATEPPATEPPASTAEELSSAEDVCGVTLAADTEYVFTADITCPADGMTLSTNTRVDGAGFTLTKSSATTNTGIKIPFSVSGVLIENVIIDGFNKGIDMSGSDAAVSNVKGVYNIYGINHNTGNLAVSCCEFRYNSFVGIDYASSGDLNILGSISIENSYGLGLIGSGAVTLDGVTACGSSSLDIVNGGGFSLGGATCDLNSGCGSTCPADLATVTLPTETC